MGFQRFQPMAAVLRGISFLGNAFCFALADLAGVPANVLEYQDHGLETRATFQSPHFATVHSYFFPLRHAYVESIASLGGDPACGTSLG
jgi:hypothetical protein